MKNYILPIRNLSLACCLAFLAILTFSCQQNLAPADAQSAGPAASISAMMAPFAPETQKFTIPSDKPSIVTGKAGTKIHVEPQDLALPDGSPIQGEIEVQLVECTKKSELLGAGLQTVSDGKLLESGGSYFIDMQANGQAVAIKSGKSVEVEFPKVTDKNMELFYGETNAQGQMNWEAADVDFKAASPKAKPETVVSDSGYAEVQTDTVYAYISGKDTIRSSKIEDVLAFMDAEEGKYSKGQIRAHNKKVAQEQNDALNANEQRERRNQEALAQRKQNAERERNARNAQFANQTAQNEQSRIARATQPTVQYEGKPNYLGVKLDRFGWFNCDRFMNTPNAVAFVAQLDARSEAGIVYFVLKTTNAIIQQNYQPGDAAVSVQLPANAQVDVFLVEGDDKDGKMAFAKATAKVSASNPVALQPQETAVADIKRAFEAI